MLEIFPGRSIALNYFLILRLIFLKVTGKKRIVLKRSIESKL